MGDSGWRGRPGGAFYGCLLTALGLGACSSSGPAVSEPVSQTEGPMVEGDIVNSCGSASA